MPELGDQLRRYFDATAPPVEHLDRPPVGRSPEPVVAATPDPRPHPRRPWFAVAAAAIVLAGAAGFVALRSGTDSADGDSRIATDLELSEDASVDPVPEISASEAAVRTTLEWELGAAPESDPDTFRQLLSDGKTLYWIGDAVYSSPDGVNWVEVTFDDVQPALLESGMIDSAWAGQLTTSLASQGSVSVELIAIDGSVRSETLSPVLEPDVYSVVDIADAVATVGGRGIVIAARLSVRDFQDVVRGALGDEATEVTSVRVDDGTEHETLIVRVAGRTERIALAEAGVADSHELEVAPSGTIGWHSPAGDTWAPISAAGPFAIDGGLERSVTATSAGFVGVTADGVGWFSGDGLTWAATESIAPSACCDRLVSWTGRALALDSRGGITVVDENGFASLPLTGLPLPSAFSRSFGAGEAGLVYLTDVDPEVPSFEIVYSPDGTTWEAQQLPESVGDLYCCYLDVYGVVGGRERVAVLARGVAGLELWLGAPTAQEES